MYYYYYKYRPGSFPKALIFVTLSIVSRTHDSFVTSSLLIIMALSHIHGIPGPPRIRLGELIPLPRLHRGLVRLRHIVLVHLLAYSARFAPAVDNASAPPLLFEVLVDCHGRQVVPRPEYALLQARAAVEKCEGLEGLAAFVEEWATIEEGGEGWVEAFGVCAFSVAVAVV